MEKYPLKLKPVYKSAIWGGKKLIDGYGMAPEMPALAESWELTVRPDGMNVIQNGRYAGMTLGDYLGTDDFPLLIKFIDAGDKLSIQVHPSKTELWYIVKADPDAWLIYGLKHDYKENELKAALSDGTLEKCMNYIHVRAGEAYFIPTGMIHAIGGGILIAEIQENSNVTYRVYDFDRRQPDGTLRELHTDKAFSVMKSFNDADIEALRFSRGKAAGQGYTLIASCGSFEVREYGIESEKTLNLNVDKDFLHLLITGGSGYIGGEKAVAGDSFFIPDGTGNVKIITDANIRFLTSSVY